ncbi:MAG: tetratricopeptide repeat protein [Nitrospirae bacterium]|nr:tetratricopeptide repeat protein [Nitrospirota bacterium]
MKPYIFLMLLVIVAFGNSIHNSFLWDDNIGILRNPQMNLSLIEVPSIFKKPIWENSLYYRPVLNMFTVVNYKLWGPKPEGFHLINILLHLINAMLLYRVGLLLFNTKENGSAIPAKAETQRTKEMVSLLHGNDELRGFSNGKLISLIAASIFAVHPMHNESVGRPVAGGESLLGLFLLISLYFFLREKRYLSLFAFSLSLLTKESAMMFPFALLILAVHKKGVKKGVIEIIPSIVLVGLYLILRLKFVGTFLGGRTPETTVTRILTMAVATFDYVRLLLMPYPTSPFYPARWYKSVLEPKVLIAISLPLLILFFAFKFKRDKVMLFLLLTPLIMLVPVVWKVNSFLAGPDQVYINERYLYIPAALFSLFISISAKKLFDRRGRYLVVGWLFVLIIFTGITISSNAIWRNSLTLFGRIAEEWPNAAFAHIELGHTYCNQNQLEKAIEEYSIVLRLRPDSAEAHSDLCMAYSKKGELNEAFKECFSALILRPDNAEAHNNLGNVYLNSGDIDNALEHYRTALRLKGGLVSAYYNIGVVNELIEAMQEYQKH